MEKLLIVFILGCFSHIGYSQQKKFNAKQIETEVKLATQKTFSAVVSIKQYDTLAKRDMSGIFTGVVIDVEGHILSAAHAVRSDAVYQINFPDGKSCFARGLGRIPSKDAAVLKIISKGNWPFAQMGWSAGLKKYQPCISIAYPASFPQIIPTLRFGYIAETNAKYGNIRSTCLMEPGDSGGPLFDLKGRVIGLHSQIENGLDSNFEIPVDIYRKYWSALTKAKSYEDLPGEDQIYPDPLKEDFFSIADLEDLNANFQQQESLLERSVFRMKSAVEGKEQLILATLIDAGKYANAKLVRDKSFLVSKNSMTGEAPLIISRTGDLIPAKVLRRDETNDLVLLEINVKMKNGIDLTANKDRLSFEKIGDFLISPNPETKGQIGVLGNRRISIPSVPSSGFLGLYFALKDNVVVTTAVQPGTPAFDTKFKVGDQLLSINGKAIEAPADLMNELAKFKPNEKISLRWKRENEESIKEITLISRLDIKMHIADTFTDGKSLRRFGFTDVFVHDTRLKPSECGGPIFDRTGKFYGINMARVSRTSSVALPALTIAVFVKEALKS